jgi:hypothetical protein
MLSCITLAGVSACSLISIKTPEKPLSARDLNIRFLTRDYSNRFVATVEKSAIDIAASETNAAVLDNALRWEIATVAESRRAATRIVPLLSLLDTWALAAQMNAFVASGGAGSSLFGAHQSSVRALSAQLDSEATSLARRLLPAPEFAEYESFVASYVHDYPLESLRFTRASVEEVLSQRGTEVKLTEAFGTIPQAMADLADRVQIYGDTVPSQIAWQARLAVRESGYSQGDFEATLRKLNARFDQVAAATASAPEISRDLVANLRQSLFDVLDRLNTSSVSTINALGAEREALATDVRKEREAVVLDAARLTSQLIRESGAQARTLVRDAMLLIVVLVILVFGVPFAAGYFIGRERGRRMSQH